MNHLVPDFRTDDDYSIPTSAGLSRPRKSSMPDDEIMELLWQNGQVVMQSQNQRSGLSKKSPPPSRIVIEDAILPDGQSTSREIRATSTSAPTPTEDVSATHLFMQEDEMASWLHYPLDDTSFDRDFCADFLYPTPSAATITDTPPPAVRTTLAEEDRPPPVAMAARPPIPPVRVATTTEVDSSRFSNFVHFSRMKGRAESAPSDSNKGVRESTVVDSSDTPAVGHDSRVSQLGRSTTSETGDIAGRGSMSGAAVAGTSSAGGGSGGDMVTCDMTVTSSPGGSGASVSASAEPAQKPPAEVRKRKARQAAADDADCYSEDVEFEPADAKKQGHGSSSTKRSRAAEVHNLSERRRRDRINEKMKALQELIPRCNKSDKASMLDEAIEYLKSLQLQVQMMSMGCSMVPMMFPGVQQYMPPMGMGMGMGMDMSMSRPMMPFPSVLAGSAMPTPSAAAHLGPRFPMPAYHMQPVPAPDPSRIQATHQSDHMLNPRATQNLNQAQVPNFADPYQRYLGLHQMQLPRRQNQAMAQPGTSKPSTSGRAENVEHHQSG